MIIGIDGTGTAEYTPEKRRHSHVAQVVWNGTSGPRWYMTGPHWSGAGGSAIVAKAKTLIAQQRAVDSPLHLVGYSRGGGYCLEICAALAQQGKAVDALVLLDAVDRSTRAIPLAVPANVKCCVSAYRSEVSGSRTSFGYAGRDVADDSATRILRFSYFASHGAIGGYPWNARENEGLGSNAVSAAYRIGGIAKEAIRSATLSRVPSAASWMVVSAIAPAPAVTLGDDNAALTLLRRDVGAALGSLGITRTSTPFSVRPAMVPATSFGQAVRLG